MKNKIKTTIAIALSNLILILFFLVICDFVVYKHYIDGYKKKSNAQFENFHYELNTNKTILNKEKNLFKNSIRKPDGLEYKKDIPIVVFGCSYAYGSRLNYNQTFTYKLAHILKRPVYNRALSWGSLQEMWYQAGAEGKTDFLKDVPLADTYIYVAMDDHFNRMYSFFTIFTTRQYMNYIDKDNKLKTQLQNNSFESILKLSYTYRHFQNKIAYNYLNDAKNKDEIINRAVLYLSKSKEELQKANNNKVNFILLLYDDMDYEEEFIKKLKQNGIIVMRAKDLTSENLKDIKYTISKGDRHPNEKAWDLLTPLIAKEIKKIETAKNNTVYKK